MVGLHWDQSQLCNNQWGSGHYWSPQAPCCSILLKRTARMFCVLTLNFHVFSLICWNSSLHLHVKTTHTSPQYVHVRVQLSMRAHLSMCVCVHSCGTFVIRAWEHKHEACCVYVYLCVGDDSSYVILAQTFFGIK